MAYSIWKNIRMIIIEIIRMISPLLRNHRSFEYLQIYFQQYRIVENHHSCPKLYQQCVRDPLCLISLMFFLTSLNLLYNCHFGLLNDRLWVENHMDIIAASNMSKAAYWLAALMMIRCISNVYFLYYNNPTVHHIKSILIDQRKHCFQWPFYYRSKLIMDYINNFAYSVLTIGSSFFITILLFMILMYFIALKFVADNVNYFHLETIGSIEYGKLFVLLFNALLMQTASYFYAHFEILAASCMQIYLKIFDIHVSQAEQALFQLKKRSKRNDFIFITNCLLKFQNLCTKNLKYIHLANHIYGRLFLLFMISQIPFNCYLAIFLTKGEHKWIFSYFYATLYIQQIACIFGVHYQLVQHNRRFNYSATRFIHIMARTRFYRVNLCRKLKLTNFAQAFHTINRYGFSYGKIELITMNEFIKVCN